jgi:2-polyprenyl-3-methyl-5-hydroxy-6-metoxy-1,4-benzoquinol methylase
VSPARRHVDAPPAAWPLALSDDVADAEVERLRARAEELAERAQYGWGHTIDFGRFTMPGLLGEKYLTLAGVVDQLGWWPTDLTGRRVADVGAFTGGLSVLLAARGAEQVAAVDELPDHLEQCRLVADAFGLDAVTTHAASLYDLVEEVGEGQFDVILCAGVLYHLSDMLVGLIELQRLLKPGGVLILESNAIENYEHSYANYGRYFGGMWWQPTALCIQDMAEHAGFERPEDVVFYQPGRALARVVKPTDPERATPPFTRGVNLDVDDRRDRVERTLDPAVMAPAPDLNADAGMLRAGLLRLAHRLLRLPMRLGYLYRRMTRRSRRSR